MKSPIQYHYLIAILLLATLGLSACQKKGENDLTAKKEQLLSLQQEKRELDLSIKALETEIAALDTNTKNVKTASVEITNLNRGDLKHYVKVQGKIDSDNNVTVMAQNPQGIVTGIYVDEGQYVKRGKLLAKMDDATIQSSIQVMQKQLELATQVFEKQKRLWDQKVGSEIQFLQAKNNKEALEQQIIATQKQADMLKIYAPISGVVDKVFIKIGQQGIDMQNGGAFKIINLNDITFNAELSESYASKVKRGDAVSIFFPTVNENVEAEIDVVGSSIHPTRRTFEIECKLPKTEALKANMIGEVIINDQSVEDVLLLPLKYVRQTELGNYVYIAQKSDNGGWVARKKLLDLGLQYDGVAAVKEGLSASDQLITAGYQNLSDGQAISFEELSLNE